MAHTTPADPTHDGSRAPTSPGPGPSACPARLRARAVAVLLVALAGCLAAGCGSSGRDLEPPIPGAVSPTRSTAIKNETGPFTLSSPAFSDGGVIPVAYTCDGLSPQLSWSGARPVGTTELALVLRDLTTGEVRWFVAGIGAGESESPEGATPPNVAQLPSATGSAGYLGPCPPVGETHTYQFELLALGQPAALPLTTTGAQAYELVQPKVVGRAQLTGTFPGAAGVGPASTLDPGATTTTVP